MHEIKTRNSNYLVEVEYDKIHERHWLRDPAISLSVSNHRCSGSRGPQPGSLTRPTQLSLVVKDFMLLCHVIDWPPGTLFQPGPIPANIARRGSLSLGMRSTCPSQRSLCRLTNSSKDLARLTNTLSLTTALLTLWSHHTRAMLRRHR